MNQIGHALTKRLTYANVVATLALFFALGRTAVAAVMISSNSQVATNTISGHQPPSGKHANLIRGSINARDLANSVKTSIKVHCPGSLQPGGDLCFDASPRGAATWATALASCQNAGLRLPTVGELSKIFDHVGAPQVDQWTDSVYFNTAFEAIELSDNSSRQISTVAATTNNTDPYRCVATPTN